MRYPVELARLADGQYAARCPDPECRVVGSSEAAALEALRAEIRYLLELCPCSTPTQDTVELEVIGRG